MPNEIDSIKASVDRALGLFQKEALANPDQLLETRPMSDEITELKLQLAAAQTDKKFSEALGEVRAEFGKVNERLSGLERSVSGTKATVVVTGIAIFGVTIAVLTYGQAWFGIGVSTRGVVKSAVSEYIEQHAPATK